MARVGSDGVLKLTYVDALADATAPTVAEATGGTDLQNLLLPNGLNIPQSGQTIDSADAGSRFDKTARGSYGGDTGTAQFHRDSVDANDLAWNTLPRGTDGFFLVGRFGGSDGTNADPAQNDWAAGDRVEVVPIEVISRFMQQIARNQTARCTVEFSIPDDIHDDATIVA